MKIAIPPVRAQKNAEKSEKSPCGILLWIGRKERRRRRLEMGGVRGFVVGFRGVSGKKGYDPDG